MTRFGRGVKRLELSHWYIAGEEVKMAWML